MRRYLKWTVAGCALLTAAVITVVGVAAGSTQAAPRAEPTVVHTQGIPIDVQVDISPTPTATGGNGGPLARTGANIRLLIGTGVLLLGAGAAAVVLGRRRRRGAGT